MKTSLKNKFASFLQTAQAHYHFGNINLPREARNTEIGPVAQ